MRLRGSNILGLAIDDRGVRCAEVVAQGSRRLVRRLARFQFPPDATPAAPAACGAALKTFLEKHEIGTRHAVIGVPARWLIALDRDLPPADKAAALDLLRLHAERLAAGGGTEMVVDVSGDVVPNTATRALLVGILKPQIERIQAIATAAGLHVEAITSSSLATHAAIGAASRGEGLVLLNEHGSEVVGGGTTAARLLKHAPGVTAASNASVVQLGSELRRTIALSGLLPAEGDRSLVVWNGAGLSADTLRELSDRSGASLRSTEIGAKSAGVEVSPIALNGEAATLSPDQFLPAIALGAGKTLPVDFLHPRLAAPKPARFGRKTVWGALAGLVVLGGLLAIHQTAVSTADEAAIIEQKVQERDRATKDAKAETARLAYARGYFENRPPILQGLREVTMAFEFNESIWATSFSLKENGDGVIQGKATDQRLVLALRERMAKNPTLSRITIQNLQEAGTRGGANRSSGGEQSFTINFKYQERSR